MFTFKESDQSIVILDNTNQMKNHIKTVLRDFKLRWNISLANKIAIAENLDDIPFDTVVIIPEFISYSINPLRFKKLVTVDAIQNLDIYTLRRATIETTVHVTKKLEEAYEWLKDLGDTFTFDTETAPNVVDERLTQKDLSLDVFRNQITMFSFAENETEAIVIINENQEMEDMVLDFLTTTESKVIMHNASFDMKIVKHRTGKFIKNIEDTQLLAWSYLNHVDTQQAKVGLKVLAAKVYSSWSVAADMFGIENKYNPDLHTYSGIDAMATMFVWNEFSKLDVVPEKVPFSELLPIIEPRHHTETPRFFYQNVALPMVKHVITLMLNGIQLDMDKVDKLDDVLIDVLQGVKDQLNSSELMKDFQEVVYTQTKKDKTAELMTRKRYGAHVVDSKHVLTTTRKIQYFP
jgi:hypothetical protein